MYFVYGLVMVKHEIYLKIEQGFMKSLFCVDFSMKMKITESCCFSFTTSPEKRNFVNTYINSTPGN